MAQEKEVTIPAPVARYFLEIHDKYIILMKKDTLSGAIIENFTYTVNAKNLYIKSLKETNEYMVRASEIQDRQIILRDEQVKDLTKQIRRQKLRTFLIATGEAVIILLLIL